jgi:hypothetical protein
MRSFFHRLYGGYVLLTLGAFLILVGVHWLEVRLIPSAPDYMPLRRVAAEAGVDVSQISDIENALHTKPYLLRSLQGLTGSSNAE